MYRSSSVTTLPSKTTLLLISTLNFKCVTFQILHKSVQYWRRHQQLLLGYYTALVKGLLSVIRAKWTLQQDDTRARHNITVSEEENVDFIKPNMWSQNSPDLNPVDYAVGGAL